MQYTVRNIPKRVDAALRKKARAEKRSLNDVLLDVLARGAGVAGEAVKQRDLSWLAGTWVEDPAFDEAMDWQDVVLPEESPGLDVPPVEQQLAALAARRAAYKSDLAKRKRQGRGK